MRKSLLIETGVLEELSGKNSVSSDLVKSQEILNELILTLEELAEADGLPQNIASKIILETVPQIQWIQKQLPEINKLGWGKNESYSLRKKIREVEHEFRRDLEKVRLSLVGGIQVEHLYRLIEKAQKLSINASFSYIKLGDRSRDNN